MLEKYRGEQLNSFQDRYLRYEERLRECELTTLETRRLRGDKIEVFKILNGYKDIDSTIFFSKLGKVK